MTGLAAGSGLGLGPDWRSALDLALSEACRPLGGGAPDLVVVFASADYEHEYAGLLRHVTTATRAREVVGCSASAVIANAREVEESAGVAVLAVRLPDGASVSSTAIAGDLTPRIFGGSSDVHGILLLADPFTSDAATLVAQLENEYRAAPILGGLATGNPRAGATALFHGTDVLTEGAVAVALRGAIALKPVVSQGCEPIGQAWTITQAERNIIHTIGGRPAYAVLVDTVQALAPDKRERVSGNLLVGLAMDEYRDEFKRGDFLIRNLIGADEAGGAIAIAAEVQVGQTIQFQIRDAQAADDELRSMLAQHTATSPAAALLFACNGRGVGLFGQPDHDARTVRELLGPLPLAGLFCNGEIGPVGTRTFLHGFTASLALIAPME